MSDLESALPFVHPSQRGRFRLLHERRRRGRKHAEKWSQLISFSEFLDPAALVDLPPDDQQPERIAPRLRELGAPAACMVVSESALDGQELELGEALTSVIGQGCGTILVCVPGLLGYYEGEWPSDRYILQRLE